MVCKICKRFFIPKKENKYTITKPLNVIEALSGERSKIFECFDCPKCGCQNIVSIREGEENDKV